MPFVYVWNAFVGHGGEKDYLMRVTGRWMCYNFLHVIISLLITICISSCISLHSSTTAKHGFLPRLRHINIPKVCFSCFRSLIHTSHLFSGPNAMQWKSLQIMSQTNLHSLSKTSYQCMAHSYAWGYGETCAVIGSVMLKPASVISTNSYWMAVH